MLANKIWQCIFLNIGGYLRNGSILEKSTLMKFEKYINEKYINDRLGKKNYMCIIILINAGKVFYKIQQSLKTDKQIC